MTMAGDRSVVPVAAAKNMAMKFRPTANAPVPKLRCKRRGAGDRGCVVGDKRQDNERTLHGLSAGLLKNFGSPCTFDWTLSLLTRTCYFLLFPFVYFNFYLGFNRYPELKIFFLLISLLIRNFCT